MWRAMTHFNEVRTAARKPLLEQWPELQQRDRRGYAAIRAKVIAALERRDRSGQLQELFDAEDQVAQGEEQEYQEELSEARVLRFVRLAKSVILAHRLRESAEAAVRERYERLVATEAGSLLPPASVARREKAPAE
jgi:hypothetical protein